MLSSFAKERARFQSIPGFIEAFKKESKELGASRARTISFVGLVCYSAFGLVDWFMYPHLLSSILPVRISFALLVSLSLLCSRTSWWKNNASLILFLNALWADLGISVLASQISGWTSLYVIGNILVTTGITMFVPWRPIVMLLYCTCTIIGYIFINSLFHPWTLFMIIPIMFLIIVSMQACFSTLLDELNRMRQLESRFVIESAHEQLKKQSDLLQQQIEAAKDIQQALLPPRIQDMEGLRIEALYEPSAHLSGDFFDAIVCGDWVYVYLADVTGHGLPAAQITFLVKEIFKTALSEEKDLSELFNVVRGKYVDHQLGYDLALQLMRIHSKTLKAEFLKSNSPNPVVIKKSGEIEEIELSASPVISASIQEPEYKSAKVMSTEFDPETKVYIYSDGAYEFFTSSGREFGPRRLLKALEKTQFEPWPEGLRNSLVSENRDDSFPDDLTVIRIQKNVMKIG